MPLRVDEGPAIPLARSASHELLSGFPENVIAALPAGMPPGVGEKVARLGVETVSQRPRCEWCWAACLEMVLRFFGVPKSKCEVATLQLEKQQSCCPESVACDEGLSVAKIDEAFKKFGFAANRFAALKFEHIEGQIMGKPALGTLALPLAPRPIVAGISWQGANAGGHLVVISGVRTDAASVRYVKVNDPFYTSGDIRYEDFRDKYGPNDNGRWVHTWADLRRR